MSEKELNGFDDLIFGRLDSEAESVLRKKIEDDVNLNAEFQIHQLVVEGLEAKGMSEFQDTLIDVEEDLDRTGFFSDEEEQDIIAGIESLGEAEFISTLKEVREENENVDFDRSDEDNGEVGKGKVISFQLRKILAIAASLIILITATWIFWPGNQNQELYSRYYSHLPDRITENVESEKSEFGFSKQDADPLDRLQEAMKEYNNGNYLSFLTKSEELMTIASLSHYKDDLLLHQAVAHLELGNEELSIDALDKIQLISDEGILYRALALIRSDHVDEAIEVLSDEKYKGNTNNNLLNLLNELQNTN